MEKTSKVKFRLRPKWYNEVYLAKAREEAIPGNGNNEGKGPKMGMRLSRFQELKGQCS